MHQNSMAVSDKVKQRSLQSIEWLARGSYLTKAIFYGSIAVFTTQFALGSRGSDPNRKEVLEQLTSTLIGKLLLVLIVIALAGHTLWRLFEIWNDPYKKGTGPGGWLYRLNYILSAITYGSLGFTALKLLLGQGSGNDKQKQIWAAKLLQLEHGHWLIIGAGAIFLIWGALQVYKGLSGKVYKSLELDGVSPVWKVLLRVFGLVGFLTVGITLCGTGWYFIKGALAKNPNWIKNMDDLIKALQALPGGWGLQLTAAGGFLMMALFMVAMARYFPVRTTE